MRSSLRLISLWLSALALSMGALGACTDDAAPPEKIVYVPDDPTRGIIFDDAGRPVPPVEQPENPTFILVVDGEDELVANVGSEVDLSVLLLNGQGDPVAGERINWSSPTRTAAPRSRFRPRASPEPCSSRRGTPRAAWSRCG